jgi:MAF protein
MTTPKLILASSSTARKSLLSKLQIPFQCISPDIDESAFKNEKAMDTCQRLAINKAHAVARLINDNAIIISSDQIACLGNQQLGKPLTTENAIRQLSLCSGNIVSFFTSLCVYNTQTRQQQIHVETFQVHFRHLTAEEISRYIERDQPLHCAGSFKAESLGAALFEKMSGNDPNSLIGLPLFTLVSFLKNEGVEVL